MTENDINQLIERQMHEWPFAAQQYEALQQTQCRELMVDGSVYRIQYNPARAVSSGAKVDKATLAKRPCFLCDANRPSQQEGVAFGIRWTFSPMIDISRDPRWGRIAEGSGEYPYLTAVMGAAMIKGYQGSSLNDSISIAACAKHFVGYGAAEGGRDYNSTVIPERQLRNVFLPPFEAAVQTGVATFMTSFNDNTWVCF